MHFLASQLSTIIGLAAVANAHFVLQYPLSLGFDDDAETTAPCGGFDATNRTGASSFPLSGDAIQILTTHPDVVFDFNVALVSDLNTWIDLGNIHQLGVGTFCFGSILGYSPWVGQPAVLQVIQHAPDGLLYQCAPITFTTGAPDNGPDTCVNSTGTSATWINAGDHGASTSSSSTLSTTTISSSPVTSAGSTVSTGSTPGTTTIASSVVSSTAAATDATSVPTLSASATAIVGSNSTTTSTSTIAPQFTGAADKTHAGSFIGFLGAAFGFLLVW